MDALAHFLRELWAERGRLAVVALGVTWGTLGLTVLVAFGGEMFAATNRTVDNFGPGLLRFRGGATTRPHAGLPAGRAVVLYPGDAELLRGALTGVRGVSVESSVGNSSLRHGERQINVPLAGVEPEFGELRRQRPRPGGRFLSPRDEAEHRRVLFLGNATAARLFGEADPVGARVELRGAPFTVVGVLAPRQTHSNYDGHDADKVYVPASTFRDLLGWDAVTMIWVGLERRADHERVAADVYRVLGAHKGFDAADREALDLFDYPELRNFIDGILVGNRLFTLVVGLLGLLVAAVGVANVTWVRVEERTREIGVLLALGARPRRVALARLAEGLVVTLAGGALGLLLAAGVLRLAAGIEMPPEARAYLGTPSLSLAVGATVVAALALAGALAGWFPARRAARLDPVEALREE